MSEYKPEVKTLGQDFHLTWPDLKVEAHVSHMRQTYRGIVGELDITHEDWGILRGGVELTLGSQSSQKELVSSIKRRTKEAPPDIDWERLIEALGITIKKLYRTSSVERLNLVHHMVESRVQHCLYPIIVHDGINIIYGTPGSGKSYFALALGLSIMTGESVVGFKPTCRHNMLLLDWEDSPEEHGSRARRIITGSGLALVVDDVPYIRAYKGLPDIAPELQRVIHDDNIELVIVDSAVYAGGANPNEDETVRAITASLRQLNVTSLVIGHDTKEQGRGVRGSKMWEAMSRNIWMLKVHAEPGEAEISAAIYHQKSNRSAKHKSVGYTIKFSDADDTTIFQRDDQALLASPTMASGATTVEKIDAVLTEAMTTKQILEDINLNGESVNAHTLENTLSAKKQYVKITTGNGIPLWGKST